MERKPKPFTAGCFARFSFLLVTLLVLTWACQLFAPAQAQALNKTNSGVAYQTTAISPNFTAQSSTLTAASAPLNLSAARRVLTLPDSIAKLNIAGGATLALARVQPDNQLRLFTSSDGGTSWNYAARRTANPILTAGLGKGVFGLEGAPTNNQLAWVGSDEALIGYTNNNGQSWQKLSDSLPGGAGVSHFIVVAQTAALKLWVTGSNELWAFTLSVNDGQLLQTAKFNLPGNISAPVSAIAINQNNPGQLYVAAGQDLLSFDSSNQSWQNLYHLPTAGRIDTVAAAAPAIWLGYNSGNIGHVVAYGWLGHDDNWAEVTNSLDFDFASGNSLAPVRQIALLPKSNLRLLLTNPNDTAATVIYYSQDGNHFHALTGYNAKNPTTMAVRPDGSLLLGTANTGLFSTDPAVAALPGVTSAPPNPLFPQNNKPNADYYPQTGHYVAEPFRAYWQNNGGLAQFGYPLTEAFDEISSEDGQIYQTQYFERARFEAHPENPDPSYQVLLGLLGKIVVPDTTARTTITSKQAPADSQFFSNTGHSLGEAFLNYWQSKGGLALFGYPITEPYQEVNPDDGKTYTVQYFERNRFEYHPENAHASNQVLLGLLGKTIANLRQIIPSNLGLVAVSGPTIIPWGEKGQVFDQIFHSPVLNRDEPYRIYLPPGYDSDTSRRYPVLYMLHGYSGNRVEWFNCGLFNQADQLINQNIIPPMIIVLPTGDQDYWVDHANGGLQWGKYVAQDVTGFIDQNFRTKADRQNRAIGGLSMGGHGGLQIGINYSQIFGIISGTSATIREKATLPDFFGDDTWFAAHDPISLAQTTDPNTLKGLKIWIDIGLDDKDWVARNQLLNDILNNRGIPHEFHLQPGGHTYDYWVADGPILLKWYASVFPH